MKEKEHRRAPEARPIAPATVPETEEGCFLCGAGFERPEVLVIGSEDETVRLCWRCGMIYTHKVSCCG